MLTYSAYRHHDSVPELIAKRHIASSLLTTVYNEPRAPRMADSFIDILGDELFLNPNMLYETDLNELRRIIQYGEERLGQVELFKEHVEKWFRDSKFKTPVRLSNMKLVIQRFGECFLMDSYLVGCPQYEGDPRFADFFFHQNFEEINIESELVNTNTFWPMLEAAAQSFYNLPNKLTTYNYLPKNIRLRRKQKAAEATTDPTKPLQTSRSMQMDIYGACSGSNTFLDVFDEFRTFECEPASNDSTPTSFGHAYHNWKQHEYKKLVKKVMEAEQKEAVKLRTEATFRTSKSDHDFPQIMLLITQWKALRNLVKEYHEFLATLFLPEELEAAWLDCDAHFNVVCQTILERGTQRSYWEPTSRKEMADQWPTLMWSTLEIMEETLPRNYATFEYLVESTDRASDKFDIVNILEQFCELFRVEQSRNSFVGYKLNGKGPQCHYDLGGFYRVFSKSMDKFKETNSIWSTLHFTARRYVWHTVHFKKEPEEEKPFYKKLLMIN